MVNKFYSQFRPLSAIVLGTMFLAGCGLSILPKSNSGVTVPSEPITLEVWRLWDESSVLDENIAAYQDRHPNVDIVVRKIDVSQGQTIYDYQSQIIKLIADGKGPDIFEIHNDWLPYQIEQLVPMPQALLRVDDMDKIYPQVVINDFVKDDKIYGLPMYIDNLLLFYNPNIFSEARITKPPKTWTELLDTAAKVSAVPGVQSAIALGVTEDHIARFADILATLMVQNGAQMTDANRSQATFDLPLANDPSIYPGAEALEFYTSFADPATRNYSYTDTKKADGTFLMPSDIGGFMEGKIAMMVGYGYQINNIKNFAPRFYFETAPLPQVNLDKPRVLGNYWGMSVSRNSKYPDVAWDFINFLQSPIQQRRYSRNAKRVSAQLDLREDYTGDTLYGSIAEQLDDTFSWYRKNTPKVEEIFTQMINAVLKNGVDPKTAVRTAVQEYNQIQ